MEKKESNLSYRLRMLVQTGGLREEVEELLVEAADCIEGLHEQISDAWVALGDHDHTGGQEPLSSAIEVMIDAHNQQIYTFRGAP